jgi:hypothetical protein
MCKIILTQRHGGTVVSIENYCCIFNFMKPIALPIISIALAFISNVLPAQTARPVKVNDSLLSYRINHIQSFQQYQFKELVVTVMEIANPSGSAHTEGTDEITTNLYFGVSEFGEAPDQSLFCIKNLYAVSNIQQDRTVPGEAMISFTYIDINNSVKPIKRKIRLKLTLQTAVIIK